MKKTRLQQFAHNKQKLRKTQKSVKSLEEIDQKMDKIDELFDELFQFHR